MYKRLTNNNPEEYNPELDFCAGCKYYGEPNGCNRPNGTSCIGSLQIYLRRKLNAFFFFYCKSIDKVFTF